MVDRELGRWEQVARAIPDGELRRQALASLKLKRFHCLGGGVYALLAPPDLTADLVRVIVAIQTISDYLDNLCDRAGVHEEQAFRTLHEAMVAAVDPDRALPRQGFYRDYPLTDDGGYLDKLVATSRQVLLRLPGYSGSGVMSETGAVRLAATGLAGLYSDLQVYKHLATTPEREARLVAWHREHSTGVAEAGSAEMRSDGSGALFDGWGLSWWEFGAACGSTLGIFVLMAMAADQERRLDTASVDALVRLYFPDICGLHILLDYFIDQDEDLGGRDLNFVSYYPDPPSRVEALVRFTRRSLEGSRLVPDAWFHRAVVRGLLALYLSDPKVETAGLGQDVRRVLHEAGGAQARLMHRACRYLRARGVIA